MTSRATDEARNDCLARLAADCCRLGANAPEKQAQITMWAVAGWPAQVGTGTLALRCLRKGANDMETSSILLLVGALLVLILVWVLVGYPKWRVWASHQHGLADLAMANNEQQIQIAKAKARKEAALLNKDAAIIEAQAVSEQITLIGQELTAHDLYLRWQWIKMMEDTHGEDDQRTVIYVPTEAQMPIMEARRKP